MSTNIANGRSKPNHMCRICLKPCERSIPAQISEFSLKLLVPEMNLSISVKPVLCMRCYKSLREAYSFRLQCLQSEKLINIYMNETDIPPGNIKLHDVVEYSKGVFNPKSDDDKPESENVPLEPMQSERESTDTNKSQPVTKEVQPEYKGSETNPSELNTVEKNIFEQQRVPYINKELNTYENNNTTLSAEPELEINKADTAPSAKPTAVKSMEDLILTSKIGPACQKYLTKTGDEGFKVRNDLLNEAVNHTVENIMNDTGQRKLVRPILHPAPARKSVVIKKVVDKAKERQLSDQAVKDNVKNIVKESIRIRASQQIVLANIDKRPSAPKPSTDPSISTQPPTPPSSRLVTEATAVPSLLSASPPPRIPMKNINCILKNNEMDKEMLKVLQNSDLFKEHVRKQKSSHGVSFVLRKVLNKDNRLLGYSVDMGNKSESDGSRQKFMVRCDDANIPSDPLTEVNPENLLETENNQESLASKSETSSTETSTTAMPRIRVRPVSFLKKTRTLNHELFPQTSHSPPATPNINFIKVATPEKVAQLNKDTGFSHLPRTNQHTSFLNSSTVMEVTKIRLNPGHLPSRLNQYSNGRKLPGVANVTQLHKQIPLVLNSMVTKQKDHPALVESPNQPVIPGLVPVTKEHLKQMGIERICITNLPPSYTQTRILPVDEETSIQEEPQLQIVKEEPSEEVDNEYTNDLEDDIDIKEEPLSYEDNDVLMQGTESIDKDSVLPEVLPNEPSTSWSQTSSIDNLLEDTDQDSVLPEVLPNEPSTSCSQTSSSDNLLEDSDKNFISPDESTRSASETPFDYESLDGLLDFREIEEYDTPEYIQINKVDGAEIEKSGKETEQQKESLKCSNSENPTLDDIPDVPNAGKRRRRRTKRLRLVSVDNKDEPPKKQRIRKPPVYPRRKTLVMKQTNFADENVCTLFTKFTSQGDYINDHDYLIGPYKRYGMMEFQINQQRCWCSLCNSALPIEDHVKHMQCHSTYCSICKLNFNNVFLLNLHVRQHIYRCGECSVHVSYSRHFHHAKTHNSSPHLTNIAVACEDTITESPTVADNPYPIRSRSCTVPRLIEENGDQPRTAIDGEDTISATDGNQLQSEETSNTNPISFEKMDFVSMPDLLNTTASSSLDHITKKKPRRRRQRKSRKREVCKKPDESQKNKSAMVENKVEDDKSDTAVERETPESEVVAESNAKMSNVLEDNNLNPKTNNQSTDKLAHSILQENPSTSQRRTLRSSNSPSSSKLNTLKEESAKTKRYPSRKSVIKTDSNTSLPSNAESDTSSKVKLPKAEPEIMSKSSNDQETYLNPFAKYNDSSDQNMLLENLPVGKMSEPEDKMQISEEISPTLGKKDCTETTKNISIETTSSGSSESLNLFANEVRTDKRETEEGESSSANILVIAAKEVLNNGRSLRAVAKKYSIHFMKLYRYCQKTKTGIIKRPTRKSRKPVVLEDGTYDVDDAFCLVCTKTFSKSKPGEEWIRCTKCHGWAHEKCVNADAYFICQNCHIDDSI